MLECMCVEFCRTPQQHESGKLVWHGTGGGRRVCRGGGRLWPWRTHTDREQLLPALSRASRRRGSLCSVLANIFQRTHRNMHVCTHYSKMYDCTRSLSVCLCLHAFLPLGVCVCVGIMFAQPYSAGAVPGKSSICHRT